MELGERDPVTGQMTSGHEWNGIEELETPIPRIVFFFLAITITLALIGWILLPAWPLGTTYTKGLLGVDQKTTVESELRAARAQHAAWMRKVDQLDYAAIQADPAMMQTVDKVGGSLFRNNCAACHGAEGAGGPGFPDLTARAWLWGGEPATLAETVRVGINSTHPKTRVSQMQAFGEGALDRAQILDVVAYVQSLGGASEPTRAGAAAIARGAAVFAANCVSCHGTDARGLHEKGAPNLTDRTWIYGGDQQSIYTTVSSGRQGTMPTWEDRLSATQRKILTLYVLSLRKGGQTTVAAR
jgi:cytochrome c oxidase cbb3-type subunit 3